MAVNENFQLTRKQERVEPWVGIHHKLCQFMQNSTIEYNWFIALAYIITNESNKQKHIIVHIKISYNIYISKTEVMYVFDLHTVSVTTTDASSNNASPNHDLCIWLVPLSSFRVTCCNFFSSFSYCLWSYDDRFTGHCSLLQGSPFFVANICRKPRQYIST